MSELATIPVNGSYFQMGEEHEAHLKRVNEIFQVVNAAKYRRGQIEHGGKLWQKPRIALRINLLFELIDAVNYNLSDLEQDGITQEDILSALYNGIPDEVIVTHGA